MSLPDPLVPDHVDLTDFPFMPVMIARLKQSRAWLLCKRKPQLAFYMLNLWTASWHGRPASSLEDQDDVLADAAMCPDRTWRLVKEEVLRGWVSCSDGRLYHPVVAEQALISWAKKVAQRNRTEAARLAIKAKKAGFDTVERYLASCASSATTIATVPVTGGPHRLLQSSSLTLSHGPRDRDRDRDIKKEPTRKINPQQDRAVHGPGTPEPDDGGWA